MTLPKFLLSGIGTITILLIAWPIIMMLPTINSEKATGVAAVAGGLSVALFTPQFWLSAVVLLLCFWYTSQLSSKILRLTLFWLPTVSATLFGSAVLALVGYAYMHRPK